MSTTTDWPLGLADGEAEHDVLETRLAEGPVITVPAITLEGDADGAPHPDPGAYSGRFSGAYSHRTIKCGVGHNRPQGGPHGPQRRDVTERQPRHNARTSCRCWTQGEGERS